jgi:archaetidylinositol phosphate synthase
MSPKQTFVESPVSRKPETPEFRKPAGESTQAFRNAPRIQQSFTSRLERRSLLWLAARMPHWINSDHLTLLGFVAMLLAGGSYLLSRWEPAGLLLATVCIAVNWFGDSLDGTLARVRNRQRPRYGFYVDHMMDSFGSLFLIAGLGASSYVDWRIAMSMLVVFLLLSIETYLSTYTLGVFRLSFGKFGPTEIRILLALGNIALWFNPDARIPGLSWRLFNFGGLIATSGMGIMVVLAAVLHTAKLYQEETQP